MVIEVVSNKEGGELDRKREHYARISIPYYFVWDPMKYLSKQRLHRFGLIRRRYEENGEWMPEVGLRIVEWTGVFEQFDATWIRWADEAGNLIPTGEELAEQQRQRADQERERAEQERQRADRLAAQLRALGIDPNGK